MHALRRRLRLYLETEGYEGGRADDACDTPRMVRVARRLAAGKKIRDYAVKPLGDLLRFSRGTRACAGWLRSDRATLSGGLAVDVVAAWHPSDIVVTGVVSAAPALATGREQRRVPPRPGSLARDASRMGAGRR